MPVRPSDPVAAPEAGLHVYEIDAVHTGIAFEIGYFGIGSVKGTFGDCRGTVRFDPADLATLAVEARINAASINTGNAERDRKLRGANLLEVARHPHLLFTSSATRNVEGDAFELIGDLTVRGITKGVLLTGRHHRTAPEADGAVRAVFSAGVTLNRTDFEVRWSQVLEAGGALVGDIVHVKLRVEAVRRPG
jgi:polyisoprenoid-binding protein YceI